MTETEKPILSVTELTGFPSPYRMGFKAVLGFVEKLKSGNVRIPINLATAQPESQLPYLCGGFKGHQCHPHPEH